MVLAAVVRGARVLRFIASCCVLAETRSQLTPRLLLLLLLLLLFIPRVWAVTTD